MTPKQHQPRNVQQAFNSPACLPFLELRTTLGSALPYATHFHSSLSLGLILEGRTVFQCPDGQYQAKAGDIVLIEPELAHSCNPVEGQPRSYHMLYLDAEWCREQAGILQEQGMTLRSRVLEAPACAEALLPYVDEIGAGADGSAFQQELTLILRQILRAEILPGEKVQAARLLRRRSELGREAFIRSFRRSAGITPGSYLQLRRLEKARSLLRSGAGIAETALLCGFADQSHFHRAFVRYFAATPRQYLAARSLSYKK